MRNTCPGRILPLRRCSAGRDESMYQLKRSIEGDRSPLTLFNMGMDK